MPKLIPAFISLALSSILVALSSDLSMADHDCEAMPAGPARTDCFIMRARVHGLRANIAADKARRESNAAKLETHKGEAASPISANQRSK